MNEKIFRKKSLDRIGSPEQLTDYIRVSTPSVWLVLLAIVILLIAALVWSVFGALPNNVTLNGIVQDGVGTCYVDKEMMSSLKVGMTVKVGEVSGSVAGVSQTPLTQTELKATYTNDQQAARLTAGEENYPVQVNGLKIADGMYEMVITVDSDKPISFLLN